LLSVVVSWKVDSVGRVVRIELVMIEGSKVENNDGMLMFSSTSISVMLSSTAISESSSTGISVMFNSTAISVSFGLMVLMKVVIIFLVVG